METTQEVTNQNAVITPELHELKKTTALESTIAENILMKYAPFFSNMAEIKSEASKINFENPTALDCEIARKLRLRLVKIRTGSDAVKDKEKEWSLYVGRLNDSANGVVKNSCKLLEQQYEAVEKHVEIAEAKRKAELKAQRTEMLSPYCEDVSIYPLGDISEDSFQDLLLGMKTAYEKKIADAAKAEEERIAREKAEWEEQERIKAENERLKKEAEAKEKQLQEERARGEAERKAIEEKQAAILKAEQEKAAKIQAEQEAKLKAEREAKEKIEAEMKAKEEAIRLEKEAELKRIEQERIEKEEAEKKAAKAPDKEKLKTWTKNVFTVANELKITGLKSSESIAVANLITEKFQAFKIWAEKEIEKL